MLCQEVDFTGLTGPGTGLSHIAIEILTSPLLA